MSSNNHYNDEHVKHGIHNTEVTNMHIYLYSNLLLLRRTQPLCNNFHKSIDQFLLRMIWMKKMMTMILLMNQNLAEDQQTPT